MKVKAKKDFIADLGQGTQKVHVGQVLDMPDTGEVLYWLDQGWVEPVKPRARKRKAKAEEPEEVPAEADKPETAPPESAAMDPGEKAVRPRARKRK